MITNDYIFDKSSDNFRLTLFEPCCKLSNYFRSSLLTIKIIGMIKNELTPERRNQIAYVILKIVFATELGPVHAGRNFNPSDFAIARMKEQVASIKKLAEETDPDLNCTEEEIISTVGRILKECGISHIEEILGLAEAEKA